MLLQNAAIEDDPDGYYAGRILCDILPIISQLKDLDAPAASNELKEAKAKNKLGRNCVFCETDFARWFSSTGLGIGIYRSTCWL
jgi:hypothetical protein